jgi:uncharacterized membrane protein
MLAVIRLLIELAKLLRVALHVVLLYFGIEWARVEVDKQKDDLEYQRELHQRDLDEKKREAEKPDTRRDLTLPALPEEGY